MRKIIQIAVSESEDDSTQWALCDDGSVWSYVWSKGIYEDVTVFDEDNVTPSYTTRKKVGDSPATWKQMADIPQGDET